ncbi:cyclin-dependent kinase inhibitor 3 family protein [Vibrio sonorensis]|uniref:cyclin-dependent kinase inhibitor 3 family protein n=1 Tax=Vibrio sonorensis TaxID=1004316 RepID=UPI0008DB1BED|nr:cyclin-dependent kinase inhibitor 3 family protein [Vibrio sonorensis]
MTQENQHPIWQLPLERGGLVLTPCPGTKGVDLDTSLAQLKAECVSTLVTAISSQEMDNKGVSELGYKVQALGMQWYHLVIEDDCAPDQDFSQRWESASTSLHQAIEQGQKVAMHCMGGSGRTGLLAAHFLLEKGWQLEEIISKVQALRPGAFTKQVQVDYIKQVANA